MARLDEAAARSSVNGEEDRDTVPDSETLGGFTRSKGQRTGEPHGAVSRPYPEGGEGEQGAFIGRRSASSGRGEEASQQPPVAEEGGWVEERVEHPAPDFNMDSPVIR